MTDKYAVIGNPIAHSKSPQIHVAFAKQFINTDSPQDITYEAKQAPVDGGFENYVSNLKAQGYKGVNITVPFKFEALLFVVKNNGLLNPLAAKARAVNTITFNNDGSVTGDNTDGIGLVNDITKNLKFDISNKKILLLGSGGAAFGVLQPLADTKPSLVIISNRTFAKAEEAAKILSELIDTSQSETVCVAKRFDDLGDMEFDLVINSTSTGLTDTALPISNTIFAKDCLAYDMMYGHETPFMQQAKQNGAKVADGLGMLVEQAAEAFYIWRGVRPQTAPVIAQLRNA